MSSLTKVDVKAVRKAAVERALKEFKAAKTTEEKHYARLALARARRAAEGSSCLS